MPRYVRGRRIQPTAEWDDAYPLISVPTVEMQPPRDSGLVDADGTPIYSVADPVGFHHAFLKGR